MIIDLFLIIVMAYGFYVGYNQGIIKTVFTILGASFGILASLRFTPAVTRFYHDIFNQNNPLWIVVAFATTFIFSLLLLKLLGKGIESVMEKVHINFVNQIIGGAVLASISAFFYSLIIWFVVESVLTAESEAVTSSKTYPFLKNYPGKIWKGVIQLEPLVGEFREFSEEIFNKVEKETNTGEEKEFKYDLPNGE
ncbi:MAG: CvpA family protein [Saprospiraceae bacterium]